MATSIHLPKTLLDALDRRARALRISRNRLIIRAIERELNAGGEWSPRFFEQLEQKDDELSAAVDELLETVVRTRRSTVPPEL
jgi:predicted transcriptional regulator